MFQGLRQVARQDMNAVGWCVRGAGSGPGAGFCPGGFGASILSGSWYRRRLVCGTVQSLWLRLVAISYLRPLATCGPWTWARRCNPLVQFLVVDLALVSLHPGLDRSGRYLTSHRMDLCVFSELPKYNKGGCKAAPLTNPQTQKGGPVGSLPQQFRLPPSTPSTSSDCGNKTNKRNWDTMLGLQGKDSY